jgi:hypothetical protein
MDGPPDLAERLLAYAASLLIVPSSTVIQLFLDLPN